MGVRGEDEDRKLDVSKWTDKRIARINSDDIAAVAITKIENGKEEKVIDIRRTLVDDKKQWQSVNPYAFGLSAPKIKEVIGRFDNIYAREIIAADDEEAFGDPGWIGMFTMENGDQIKIVRGSKNDDEKNYYVKREGTEYYYLVAVSTFDTREKKQGNIFGSNPLKVSEESIDEIEVNDVDKKKKFIAIKKGEPEEGEEGEEGEDAQNKIWRTPKGDVIEISKVKDIIKKIEDFNPEIVPKTTSLPGNELTLRIVKEGETKEYTISMDFKLDNDKECHFLKVSGEDQEYCLSTSQVSALQKALP